MNPSDEHQQPPPAKVLLPLGAVLLIGSVLALLMLDLGPVSSFVIMFVSLIGLGLLWQGFLSLGGRRKQ